VLKAAFLIPGDIDLPTGGYRYDREVLARLPAAGFAVRRVALGASFPAPGEADIASAVAAMAAESRDTALMVDGLALGAMPPEALQPFASRLIAVHHHPLGLEAGLEEARARWLIENERAVLRHAAAVIVTSHDTARIVAELLEVPKARITVAEPGTDAAGRASGSGSGTLNLLAVGTMSARKAFDLLARALAPLTTLGWHMTIAGAADRDPAALSAFQRAVADAGIAARVTLTGAVDKETLDALYDRADVFVSSSLYEGYGMALAEALARGLPMVASTGGAAASTVPDAAALKVPPGDGPALTAALRTILTDGPRRLRMADAAWAAAALLPDWDDTARTVAETVTKVIRP
jgi:glycosyltransferase involved in cell wall biosynthesis